MIRNTLQNRGYQNSPGLGDSSSESGESSEGEPFDVRESHCYRDMDWLGINQLYVNEMPDTRIYTFNHKQVLHNHRVY